MLQILIIIPFVGSFVIITIPDKTKTQIEWIKIGSIIFSGLTLVMSFYIWSIYDTGIIGYQITQYSPIGFASIHLGIDGISLYYVLLTGILTPISLLASWSNIQHQVKLFNIIQLIICGLLISVWLQIDLLVFYISFEAVLIPLFFTIIIWSSSDVNSRDRSATLLFLYTLAGSLFILLAIVDIYSYIGIVDFNILYSYQINYNIQPTIWVCFAIAIAVKTPIVPLHIWLPRAHADAPLAGSIILAGTVLKLSTYGILRIIIPIFPEATNYFVPLVQIIGIISLIYSSLTTIRENDFKGLVAYSSVAHIAVVLLGLFSNSYIGITGAIILSIAHGFVSPSLFVLFGGVLYDRYHSRDISYYRGLAQIMPLFSIISFIIICANIGVPLSINWVGEFIALSGVFQISAFAGAIAASGIVLSACYSIWIWGRINSGQSNSLNIQYYSDISRREIAVLMPFLILTILLGIKPGIVIDTIAASVSILL